jgi:hypothetical protein
LPSLRERPSPSHGVLGVPERPHLRKVMRWEPLESLYSRV